MSEEIDVNTAFDNLLLAEDIAEKTGFEEGYKVGKNKLLEGYHLGYHRASVIAAQLGYYSGILGKSQSQNFSQKIALQKEKLVEDISNFPTSNDSSVEILKCFDDIKLNFHKFCSMTKMNFMYSEADKLDF